METRDDAIFIRHDNALNRAGRRGYENEDVFQKLVKEHPELLSGEQLRPGDPIRWFVVDRELGIADRIGGSDRWSIDHLLLDQDGIPTFVEVKRASDTRIRREVVGQMLEYAANAMIHWPVARIREVAVANHGEDLVALKVTALRGAGADIADADVVEEFWGHVERNLRAGRLRLLFVADAIPRELRRIIEFLNEHMTTIEVLGVEVVRYGQGDVEAYVPRVVGQTEQARVGKEPGGRNTKTTEAEFLAACEGRVRSLFERLLAGVRERRLGLEWRTAGFSVRGGLNRDTSLFYGYPPGGNRRELASLEAFLRDLPDAVEARVPRPC